MKVVLIFAMLCAVGLFAWATLLQYRVLWHVKSGHGTELRRALRKSDFATARDLVEPRGYEALARLQSARSMVLILLIGFGLLGLGNAILATWK